MKTIGLDLRLFGTQHGGIGRYCQELFPKVLSLDSANRYVIFFNPNAEKEIAEAFKTYKNVQLVPSSVRHYSFMEQSKFLRQLNKYNLDLVHFPNFNFPILYKRPFIVTIHDMVHHKIGGAKKSHFFHFLAYKKVIGMAARNSQTIITVSQESKKDIAKFLEVSPDKIKVIYEGSSLDPEVSQRQVEEVKARYLINRPYFLFVGVLERKKNLVTLTRGFDYFISNYKLNMDLVVVGKADAHYPEIRHKAMDIVNNNRLVFTGGVEDIELRALYKGAFAFVTASLHEGFGLPGVEAMSFGLPLLVSNTSVFNEIYDNAAMYFNPLDPEDIAEKMKLLAMDSKFYTEVQKKSYERAQLFNWDNAAKETLETYKQCIS